LGHQARADRIFLHFALLISDLHELVVEAAGIEPASKDPTQTVLHT
jgi:hypothetical protein